MGSICVRCQKEISQSLLPTAISLMPASKVRCTIFENVDNKDQRFTWLLERHQQMRLDIPTMMLVVSNTLTANGSCPDEQ
jgi:hypothetical protein